MADRLDDIARDSEISILGRGARWRRDLRLATEVSPYMVAAIGVLVVVPGDPVLKATTALVLCGLTVLRNLAGTRHPGTPLQDAISMFATAVIGAVIIISGQPLFALILLLTCLRVASEGSRRSTAKIVIASIIVLSAVWLADPGESWNDVVTWFIFLPVASFVMQRRAAEQTRKENLNPVLVDLVADMLTADDPRQSIVDTTVELGRADVAILFEGAGEGDLLSTAFSGASNRTFSHHAADRSLVSKCFAEDRTILVPMAEEFPDPVGYVEDAAELRSLAAIPIGDEDGIRGVLFAGWKHRVWQPDGRDLAVVSAIALEARTTLGITDHMLGLELSASLDPLTGLYNRRRWDRTLQAELRRAGRNGRRFSIGIIDIDHFKRFNDRQGHQEGDEFLKESAGRWSGVLRTGDELFRWGGEEFTLLLPDCPAASAIPVVERVRAATPRGETVSAGVATWNGSESAEDLVGRADAALYEAKERGRNRAVAADGPAADSESQAA